MAKKIVAIYNWKGGQGKSTLSIILGSWAGLKGLKVAVIDGDDGRTVWDWVEERKLKGKLVPFKVALVSEFDFSQGAINGISDYDWIFIDFPAAFNAKIETALSYCDLLILPIKIGKPELARFKRLIGKEIIREIPKIFVLNQILWFERQWLNPIRREVQALIRNFNCPILEIKYRSDYGKLMEGSLFWDNRKPEIYSGDLWTELRALFQAVGLPGD
jgi:cellulose biosynthesis protein BcsQ